MMNGIELKKFEGNIVSLNIQVPQDLAYEITDTAGNVKKGKVDVSSYVQ
jgi:hypothetical protein